MTQQQTPQQDKNPLLNKYRALLTLAVVLIAISFIFSAASGVYYFRKQSRVISSYSEAQKVFWHNREAKTKSINIRKDSIKLLKANEALFPDILVHSEQVYQIDFKKLLEATRDSSRASVEAMKEICDKRITVLDSLMFILFTNIQQRDSLIAEMECLQSSDSLMLRKNLFSLDSLKNENKKLIEQVQLTEKKGKVKFWTGLGLGTIIGSGVNSLFN
jgi:hypothetical protein